MKVIPETRRVQKI